MKTTEIIGYVKQNGKTIGELHLVEKGDIWPGYAENMKLQTSGYWYGNTHKHEFLSKDFNKAIEIINNYYGATFEELKVINI